jgi:hypothetical protein
MRFDPNKAIQAAAVVLKQHRGVASRLRLLKILVIADREALGETLELITADALAAMDHGPVPSATYDMLKGTSLHSELWDRFIQRNGPQNLQLVNDPGVSRLSRYEIEKLQSICDRFRDADDYALAHYTHTFKEWAKNKPVGGSSKHIPLSDRLEALDLTEHRQRVEADIQEEHELDQLFGRAAQ